MPKTNLQKPNIILICKTEKRELIAKYLENDFNVICKEKCTSILFLLRTKQINAVLSYFSDNGQCNFELYDKITRTRPSVPKLALLKNGNDLELVRKCGETGFMKVMLYSELDVLPHTLHQLIEDNRIKVPLEEVGITLKEDIPELLRQALQYIEKEYIQLKSIEEITDYLDTSYKTLSSYLKQALLPSPKVILMFFKIRHSLYLLKENTLSNKEIAYKSGFTDEKRFAECMRRMFDKTPGECRCELYAQSVNAFWQNTLLMTH